jgi:branched-chain amino acid transport system substrate-binding protein
MYLVEPFYWDLDDLSRQWSKRFFDKFGKMPNFVRAGAYSAVMNYLKAVQAEKTDDAAAVMKRLKTMPINDMFARNGKIRADGRMVHDMYLVQVKAPSDIKESGTITTSRRRSRPTKPSSRSRLRSAAS